jgi:hypothetical protein
MGCRGGCVQGWCWARSLDDSVFVKVTGSGNAGFEETSISILAVKVLGVQGVVFCCRGHQRVGWEF